jgi:hypothetical protein
MKSPQPLVDLVFYVALPCVLGFRSTSYRALVRAIITLCLLALIPQMLLDRYYDSVIPGVGYLLAGIPALLIATLCFLIRRFVQRRPHNNANPNT